MSSSYSDETVLSKLSALNDTQDSIVAVAQWVMFHRYITHRQPARAVSFPAPRANTQQTAGETFHRTVAGTTEGEFIAPEVGSCLSGER